MRSYYEEFRFCPHCGTEYRSVDFDELDVVYRCRSCRFDFYQNAAPAATAVVPRINSRDSVLLITRNTDPGNGLLALPGGFLRYGEDPANAARREVKEEADVDVEIERLLHCTLVDYHYRGCRLWSLELAFLAAAVDGDIGRVHTAEARTVGFYDVRLLLDGTKRLAFPEQRDVIRAYAASFE